MKKILRKKDKDICYEIKTPIYGGRARQKYLSGL
jgi:hypothetical protein